MAMQPCCQEEANREFKERAASGLVLRVCRVCGRRHFELDVDPAKFGLTGKGSG